MLRAELQIINLFEGFWRLISFRREKSQLGKKVLLLQEVNKYQFLSHSSIFCILLSSLTFFSHIPLSPVLIFFHVSTIFLTLSLSVSPTPSQPPSPSHASLCIPFSFPSQFFSSPGATVCIHPVAVATRGGHMSGWMNKRPRDPHTQRERERKSERERRKIRFHF